MGIGFPGDSLKQAKAKYRDLSTAAAKAPPSVEMTFVGGYGMENEQQRQKQIPFGGEKQEGQRLSGGLCR